MIDEARKWFVVEKTKMLAHDDTGQRFSLQDAVDEHNKLVEAYKALLNDWLEGK